MRVLHVVNISFVLPYYIGKQFDYFKDKGIEFYVACQPSDHLSEYAIQKGFNKIELNILREINLIKDLEAIFKLKRYIRQQKIDIVIAHTPKGGLIGMIASYLAGVENRIYFRHGLMYETSKGIKRMILKNVERLTGFLASKVVCVSKSVMEVSARNNLSANKKNLILNKGTCNGIDCAIYNKEIVSEDEIIKLKEKHNIKNETIIGYVGRLVNDKGINELIQAWQKLSCEYSNIKLLLAGPYEERDSIGEEIKQIISSDRSIIHTGLIKNVIPYYAIMDIFILPSYREGFPTVVLEASAMELPIITTRATGCVDSIINKETGIFTAISPDSIYESIKYYLQNPEISKMHGKNGRSFVEKNFNQKLIWKEISERLLLLKN